MTEPRTISKSRVDMASNLLFHLTEHLFRLSRRLREKTHDDGDGQGHKEGRDELIKETFKCGCEVPDYCGEGAGQKARNDAGSGGTAPVKR